MMCDYEIWKRDPKKRGFWNKITSLNMWTWESEGCFIHYSDLIWMSQ
jgi:hypothetical protein